MNIIRRNWDQDEAYKQFIPPYEPDEEDITEAGCYAEEEDWPETEGNVEINFGWVEALLSDVAPDFYCRLIGAGDWDDYYTRPTGYARI